MWSAVQNVISQVTGQSFTIKARYRLTGGDINQAECISDEKNIYFVKYNHINYLNSFQAEALSLSRLSEANVIKVPDVIAIGHHEKHAFLILTFHQMDKNAQSKWPTLGKALAQLHSMDTFNAFGWQQDNFIGTSKQCNHWSSNWSVFFSEYRLGPQLKRLAEKGIILAKHQNILNKCRQRLDQYAISPSLLHGDLWQGNVGFEKGQPIIFDPASYYGDRETDIAMTELFGGFPPAFYQSYFSYLPPSPNYEEKKKLYNLYHLLNHANMFGGHYIDQAKDIINSL
ncbi:fructosamine kinase family protein [Thalassotalea ganghwensis]